MVTGRSLNCPRCGAPLDPNTEIVPGALVHVCSGCYGSFYRKAELAVPLDIFEPKASDLKCPDCGKGMELGSVYEGRVELDRCKSCGGVWFDAGEVDSLRRLAGVDRLALLPDEQGPDDAPASSAAPAPARVPDEVRKKARAAQKSADAPPVSPAEMEGREFKKKPPVAVVQDGRRYAHFQTSVPVTTAVLGEFPWVAKVGDQVQMDDFVAPPFLLSRETEGKESNWTVGEHIEGAEVWAAFGLPDAPPAMRGVGPAQPNPWEEGLTQARVAALAGIVLVLGAYFYRSGSASGATVLDTGFSFSASDPEKSRVTPVFDVPGHTANIEITLDTNLDNHWAGFDLALIEAETDKAYNVGQEVSFYHGVEDHEAWNEGSPYERLYIPSVPAGRYYLRVEPEETDVSALSVHVRVRRDVPLARVPAAALVLLLLPMLVWWFLRDLFESSRWMESDHPPSNVDDEDDD